MDDELIEIAALLRRAQLRKQLACDAALARWSMSLPQWGLLRAAARTPDASTHALATSTGQSDQAAGAVVARLEQRGLLERRSGPGRAIRHHVTEDGRALLRDCDAVVAEVMEQTLAGFEPTERTELRRLLERLAEG